ncbi:MAG: SNF2-related protein [Nevskiales bacterium]|nr:SNF2-related protein [Nevskiales bacterium]
MRSRDVRTIDLFGAERAADSGAILQWPDGARFPLNASGFHVEDHVWQDLSASERPLIVAGYASLDRLIDFVATSGARQSTRLLFGNEPFASRRQQFDLGGEQFARAAEDYWLDRGISLLRSAPLIRAIELLKSGQVQARYVAGGGGLHAKIYCGQEAATLGSSNFTEPGLRTQLEANARFTRKDSKRFDELWQIAENYWQLGRNYRDELIALLEKLLRVVNWDEALARACAELLEGDWAQNYLREDFLGQAGSLWPSQKQGIGQALYVLLNQGSVLLADATGAGKTRTGTYLIGAICDHILRTGRLRKGKALMICPPTVEENWRREAMLASVPLDIYSHGKLSHERSKHHDLTLEELRRAQLLCVDEGHNFLNVNSARTQRVLRNMADHVLLLTATPINRGVTDLLRIADLLGADNLDEGTLKAFQKMLGVRQLTRTLTEPEIRQLRQEIQKFTVRRTKKVLNTLIQREPEAYRDKDGKMCRFPRHIAEVYTLDESQKDREIAARIRILADSLHGVTHFEKPIEMPDILRKQGVSEERYLAGRISSASKLARYVVMRALRSSRAALLEHVLGTEVAINEFGLSDSFRKDETGNQLAKVRGLAGRTPTNRLNIDLPDWLTDPDRHRAACEDDARCYEEIVQLARALSAGREQAKAARLAALLDQHSLILAFDSRPISLAIIRRLLRKGRAQTLLAWGDAASDREEMLRQFAHGSTAKDIIGLCSDSLSEGVNLQQASALVHLDMPSVVRIAEQRAGRVDRMDSPHKSIQVWWPDDAPEFALSSDEHFVERYETVEKLLGSNMPLPEHLQAAERKTVSAQQMIAEYERTAAEPWDGIDDAFSPVRGLVEGDAALVPADVYAHYRSVTYRVLSRVSLVTSRTPWAFFCLSSGNLEVPRWIFLSSYNAKAQTELLAVVAELRERLGPGVLNLPLDERASRVLETFLKQLPKVERQLLARKKQRALVEMEAVVKGLLLAAGRRHDDAAIEHLKKVEQMLVNPPIDGQPDWDEVASRWLDAIRPIWFDRLKQKRQKPLLLKDIRKDLLHPDANMTATLEQHFQLFPVLRKPEERIRACIVGVPGS